MVIYKCDCCKKTIEEYEDIICLGSSDNTLYCTGAKRTIKNFKELHFCSKNCFTNYFF